MAHDLDYWSRNDWELDGWKILRERTRNDLVDFVG